MKINASLITNFWRTKKAILEDTPLYDWKDSELERDRYLKPITFNVVESILAALPGLVILWVLFLVVLPAQLPEQAGEAEGVLLYRNVLLGCVLMSFYLLIPPVFTGVLAPFAGTGSVRPEYRTPLLKKRATRAYLYFDGAYGIYTQSLMSLCWILIIWVSIQAQWPRIMAILGIVILCAGIYQLYLSFSKIPKALFRINGYSTRVRRFWQKKMADDPPWNRYQVYYIFGGFVSSIVLAVFTALLEVILENWMI